MKKTEVENAVINNLSLNWLISTPNDIIYLKLIWKLMIMTEMQLHGRAKTQKFLKSKFSGDITTFKSFLDMFKTLIHENDE